jgi:hypothetical protein
VRPWQLHPPVEVADRDKPSSELNPPVRILMGAHSRFGAAIKLIFMSAHRSSIRQAP